MNLAEIDLAATLGYLRLETVAIMASILVSFSNVVFVVLGRGRNVYLLLGARTALSLLADCLWIPHCGVYGAALSNLLTNLLLSAVCILHLSRQGNLRFCRFRRADGAMFRAWCRSGVFSGLQQFIDNFVYAVMICKMVNMVAEQGNYWIANNFIWGWLLIPISALGEVIRSDCKEGYHALCKRNYVCVAALSIALWAVTLPGWLPFFREVQGLSNAAEIFSIVLRLVPFYIAYAGSAIIDNIFVGLGKTGYPALNSLIVNVGYYGIFYLLYKSRALRFAMHTIIRMFGFGMVVHLAISLFQARFFAKKSASPSQVSR